MLTDEEVRLMEEARFQRWVRRGYHNKLRYIRRMRRIDPRWGLGVHRGGDPLAHLLVFGTVVTKAHAG